MPEYQASQTRPVERPRVDSSAPLSKLVRTMSLEMPPPPAPAPSTAPAPMPVEPPPLPAACSGFASMDSAVLAASTSIPSASFNNVWRPQSSGQGFTTGSGAPPPLTNSQSLPAGFPTAATTDWVPPAGTINPPAFTKSKSTGAARPDGSPSSPPSPPIHSSQLAPLLALAGAPGEKPAPSPNKVLAVACCKLVHDKNGNTAFVCRYPGCEKSYASRDAVRKHCRIHHLQWLRTLERVTTHEEEVVEAELPIKTQKRSGGGGKKKKAAAAADGAPAPEGSDAALMPLNPFSPTMSAPQRVGKKAARMEHGEREERPGPQPHARASLPHASPHAVPSRGGEAWAR